LLGIAIDPNFASDHFIYLYYTVQRGGSCSGTPVPANRVSRWTLGDDNRASGELILIDNVPSPAGNHNGGDLNFGPDGLLYVSVGDGGSTPQTARQLNALTGKILRIAPNGDIPASNPYRGTDSVRCNLTGGVADNTKKCQEIYASGLRNPFRMAFDPNALGTRFFINDVGQNTWEEIDLAQAGADYGWNVREGHCANGSTTDCGAPPAGLTNPLYDYGRDTNCSSITGGAFVPNGLWPAAYDHTYLFADYVCGKIFTLRETAPGTWTRGEFTGGLGGSSAVHLRFGPWAGPGGATQALYYTSYAGGGQIRRIGHGGGVDRAPTAAMVAAPRAGRLPLRVAFDGRASADPDPGDTLTWEWDFGDGATATTGTPQTSHTYTVAATRTATLRVRDSRGALSGPVTVPIGAGNDAPTPTIIAPQAGTAYVPGRTYTLTGRATDPQDGTLADTRLSWQILLHHNEHTHPALGPVTGNTIAFTAPSHDEGKNYLEIRLTATDAQGISTTTTRALALGGTSFSDLAPTDPDYAAISDLAARGIVLGYGNGRFGAGDISLRAQAAALIIRAMGWQNEAIGNPFPDRGPVDDELWAAVATLHARGIARGYADGTYRPTGPTLRVQIVAFISRAMVAAGRWAAATEDEPTLYPNVQTGARDRLDLVTYVHNAGALPDRPANANWADWDAPASRGWFARVLAQALDGR
jgi:PKD repeat protein